MKFAVNRSSLRQAVTGLSRVIAPRVTLPVLGHVRFDLADGGLTASGTDLDQHASYRFGTCTSEGAGSVLLPLQGLKDLTKGRDGQVEFEAGQDGVTVLNHVEGHEVRTPLAVLDTDEWPSSFPAVETQPAEGFLETYRRLMPFASDDSTRYVLNGVYIDAEGKGRRPVTMVATDGRRLTACNSMVLPIEKGLIVPSRKFLVWSGLEGPAAIGVRLFSEVSWFGLQVGPWTYSTRTVDGTYPNWRQVVPPEPGQNRLVFAEDDAQALCKILPGFPGHDGHDGAIGLHPGEGGKLVIKGRGADDRSDTELELTGGSQFMGTEPTGVNRRYLLDALEAGFREFTYPDCLCPLRAEDGRGGIHVLMPLRLGNEQPKVAPVAEETQGPDMRPESQTNTPAESAGQEETMSEKTEQEPTALDRLLLAYEQAKTKLREAQAALAEVAGAIKETVRENRQLKTDVESVRAGLAKLQQIKV